MRTIKLRVNDRVYDRLMIILEKFHKDEVEVIADQGEFGTNQKYLANELDEILKGNARFVEMEEAERRLESIISKHENSI